MTDSSPIATAYIADLGSSV